MAYIGNVPLPQATEARVEVTATASQTSFTGLSYVENFLDVYLNGVKLSQSAGDFTATDGTSCTLASGAAADDIVAFVSRTQTSALMALPLKDSAGNNVLSESSGVVTLGNLFRYAQIEFSGEQTNISDHTVVFNQTVIDAGNLLTTNYDGSSTNSGKIRFNETGLYLVFGTSNIEDNQAERRIEGEFRENSTAVWQNFSHIIGTDSDSSRTSLNFNLVLNVTSTSSDYTFFVDSDDGNTADLRMFKIQFLKLSN